MDSVVASLLASAIDALDAGETRRSLRIVHGTHARAIKSRERHMQARASLVMDMGYLFRSRMELGAHFSSRAAALFASQSDPGGQADAMSVESYCASALGRTDNAITAATRGVFLHAERQAEASAGVGLNRFGAAPFWAGDFGTARGALDASVW